MERELLFHVTKAVRSADKKFQTTGGSSRHWVHECFLPALENEGLSLVLAGIQRDALRWRATQKLKEVCENNTEDCGRLGDKSMCPLYSEDDLCSPLDGVAIIPEEEQADKLIEYFKLEVE